jgi:hypothetical protein
MALCHIPRTGGCILGDCAQPQVVCGALGAGGVREQGRVELCSGCAGGFLERRVTGLPSPVLLVDQAMKIASSEVKLERVTFFRMIVSLAVAVMTRSVPTWVVLASRAAQLANTEVENSSTSWLTPVAALKSAIVSLP